MHQRVRRFDTGTLQRERAAGREMCMAVRAGGHVFLRGQGGATLEGGFAGLGDAAAQADQAMRNAATLLGEAGARPEHVRKVTIYLTDRAWREPVAAVLARHFALHPGAPALVRTEVIVAGLAAPEMLVAIDVDAVVPEA